MNPLQSLSLALGVVALLIAGCGSGQPDPAAPPDTDTTGPAAAPDPAAEPEFDRENTKSLGLESELEPAYGDWILRRLPAEMPHLNPITSTDGYAQVIEQHLWDSLLDIDPETLQMVPKVAKSWDESEDHLKYTFHLRDDVTFTDGEPLTAHDVKFTFDTLMDDEVDAAHYRNYFLSVDGCEVIDDHTIVFNCNTPYWLSLAYIGGLPILPEHIYGEGDFNKHPNARDPVGSGPYYLESWDTNQQVVLARNESYWGQDEGFGGYIDKWIMKIITDDNAAMEVALSGGLDYIGMTPEQWVGRGDTDKFNERFNKKSYFTPFFNYIGWNMRKPMFEDKMVRRAMTMMLDRETIRQTIFRGLAQTVTSNFMPGTPQHNADIEPWPFDPVAAQLLLADAGWTDTNGDGILDKDGVDFRFELTITNSSPEAEQLATVYKEELARAGIEMSIRPLEWAVMIENVHSRNVDAWLLGWSSPPFMDLYQIWHSSQADSGSNYGGFNNAEADQIIEETRRTFDRERRIEMFHRFQEILHEEQPYVFMFAPSALLAVDKRVENTIVYPMLRTRPKLEWFVPEDLQRYGN